MVPSMPSTDIASTAKLIQSEFGGDVHGNTVHDAYIAEARCHVQVMMDGSLRVTPHRGAPYEGAEYAKFASMALGLEPVAANDNEPAFDLRDWTSDTFNQSPEPVDFLVDGTIEAGVPGVIAAMGDTGKSFSMLELCRRVAFGSSPLARPIFGGRVLKEGTAVFLTAEDSRKTVHRRLADLDPAGARFSERGERLITVPLPDAGGVRAFWRQDKSGMVETDDWKRFCDQLAGVDDLAVVCVDPLASFAHAPINEDPAAGAFVTASLARLTAETGASGLFAHHMRKSQKPVETLAEARDAIRGTSALVDGVRMAYALWPADERRAKAVCKELGRPFSPGCIVLGGVVKANGAARRIVSTYARNGFGLLEDISADLKAAAPKQDDTLAALALAIADAAAAGQPFTKTGASGLYQQRHRLPEPLKTMGRNRLETLADTALEAGEIVSAIAKGNTPKWLDVRGGQFAEGYGEFQPGASS